MRIHVAMATSLLLCRRKVTLDFSILSFRLINLSAAGLGGGWRGASLWSLGSEAREDINCRNARRQPADTPRSEVPGARNWRRDARHTGGCVIYYFAIFCNFGAEVLWVRFGVGECRAWCTFFIFIFTLGGLVLLLAGNSVSREMTTGLCSEFSFEHTRLGWADARSA
ncbi:hypothetical protein AOQ84DRAFT_58877 [Glonium stellatum]|uniref:Uncharacterized protein n=1 Tax=Glonium stellatum TaxID=574774 RepID=A0A8E2EZK7_9PEZI|nr:hypothetical protein AOQ84DRAFT_58877 [Glonium stellatum]